LYYELINQGRTMKASLSKKNMFEELGHFIGVASGVNIEMFGKELALENLTFPQQKALPYNSLLIWHLFDFLFDYAINAEWDKSHPIINSKSWGVTMFHQVKTAEAFIKLVEIAEQTLPRMNESTISGSLCEEVSQKAVARMKIDLPGHLPQEEMHQLELEDRCLSLHIKELALLVNMTEQAVRNAATKDRGFPTTRASIEPSEAERWLDQKKGFLKTKFIDSIKDKENYSISSYNELVAFLLNRTNEMKIKREDFIKTIGWTPNRFEGKSFIQATIHEEFEFILTEWQALAVMLDVNEKWFIYNLLKTFNVDNAQKIEILNTYKETWETVSVPAASDGSSFIPKIKNKNGYRIGKKGDEKPYENYWDALEALRNMDTPYWRRPNKKTGKMGIVKGIAWKDHNKLELEEMTKS